MQYSIKSLMALTFIVAVLCGLVFSMPSPISNIIISTVFYLLSAILVTTIIYGEGSRRTAAIGATVAVALMVFSGGPWTRLLSFRSPGVFSSIGLLLLTAFLVVGCGWAALLTHRWLSPESSPSMQAASPPPPPPAEFQPNATDRRPE